VPASGSALSMLEMTLEQLSLGQTADLPEVLGSVHSTMAQELPPAIAGVGRTVLDRLRGVSLHAISERRDSFVPPVPKEAPLPPWLPGRRILGGFYVLRALGAGGVGSVFVVTRAEDRHREDAPRFALKVPDYSAEAARTLSEEQFLTLFRDEAGALLALPRQRNLATFVTFDAGSRPKPILVMELVEGPTLERALERGELSTERALKLLDGICDGLASMHKAGIGHLDVKPSNVILRAAPAIDATASPVLVDFGLAGRHIRPGCATGPYGAPEIWGLVPDGWDAKPMPCDVYAFSCLAYEVLTGDTLFEGPSELAVINAHLSHDGYPEKLLALRQHPRLAAVCDLIANGLRQHPGERISIAEMRAGFRELGPALGSLGWPIAVEVAA
jgi:eukaryotic-like serine/threonine-protein kinase